VRVDRKEEAILLSPSRSETQEEEAEPSYLRNYFPNSRPDEELFIPRVIVDIFVVVHPFRCSKFSHTSCGVTSSHNLSLATENHIPYGVLLQKRENL